MTKNNHPIGCGGNDCLPTARVESVMRPHHGDNLVYLTANDHQSIVRARGEPVSVAEDACEPYVVTRKRRVHQGYALELAQLHCVQPPTEVRRADQHSGVDTWCIMQLAKEPGQRNNRAADCVDQSICVASWHIVHAELMTRRKLLVRDAESEHLQVVVRVVFVIIVVQRHVDDTPVQAELGRHTPRHVAPQVYAIAITPLLPSSDQESAEGDKSNAAERRVIRA